VTARRLTIRTRTALAFAVVFIVLAAGVLAFVSMMTQWALSGAAAVQAPPGPQASSHAPDREAIAIVRTASEQQWLWAGVGVVAAGLLAGIAGWIVSRRMLRPLDAITRMAEQISATTLDRRIALDGPDDELRRLARTIDALFARLEASFAGQRRFVAQASHELRTPLAVQRTALQVGLTDDAGPEEIARTRDDLLEANRRTEQLVEGLLVLAEVEAEAERGLDGRAVRFSLGDLVSETLAEHTGAAQRAGVRLRGGAAPNLPAVAGDPVLVRQLLRNLVDNAIEYNVPGGTVDVRVDAGRLRAENTGAPVGDALLRTMREPFVRADPHARASGLRRHSGIGLSIVDAVVRAHGWSMVLRARTDGGLVVDIATDGVSSASLRAARP
jgi:signal transduction histidine kinase